MIIGLDAFNAEQAITAWEDEGGSGTQPVERQMIGTVNQIAWAAQIKVQVENEFDRVRAALESAATKQSGRRRMDTQVMIEILEEKRGEVMAHEQAGYFIHDWQEVRGQVRESIVADARYKAIKSRPALA